MKIWEKKTLGNLGEKDIGEVSVSISIRGIGTFMGGGERGVGHLVEPVGAPVVVDALL